MWSVLHGSGTACGQYPKKPESCWYSRQETVASKNIKSRHDMLNTLLMQHQRLLLKRNPFNLFQIPAHHRSEILSCWCSPPPRQIHPLSSPSSVCPCATLASSRELQRLLFHQQHAQTARMPDLCPPAKRHEKMGQLHTPANRYQSSWTLLLSTAMSTGVSPLACLVSSWAGYLGHNQFQDRCIVQVIF